MKSLLPFVLLLVAAAASAQVQTLFFSEDFDQSTNAFGYDSAWMNNAGTNRWIINNNYTGGAGYPNTTPQDSTVAGIISGAPHSTYAHIYDAASTVTNASYNPAVVSDRFMYTLDGFCTLGHTDVTLAFFYLCQGTANAYGEVYYSANGGPWTKTGAAKYNNQTLWKYEVITDSAFNNVANLRIGFRWSNDNNSVAPPTMAFAIDDILCVGTVDPAVQITATPQNAPVCRGGMLHLQINLSQQLCAGIYSVELSNFTGSFQSPTGIATLSLNGQDTVVHYFIPIGASIPPGNCYKVRVDRSWPSTMLGVESACFQLQSCPNVITTLQPNITLGQDTPCAQSIITVPFYSTGAYNASNSYVLQLSDEFGSFNTPTVVSSNPDRNTYDPATGSDAGVIGGLLPIVPAGCSYFLRVVSTNPVATSSMFGPFCIKRCDITTNRTESVLACVTGNTGTSFTLDVSTGNAQATYYNGNIFSAHLYNALTLAHVADLTDYGNASAVGSTTFTINLPSGDSLIQRGIHPGFYYMSIEADSSSQPWNAKGTLVGLTIGYISATLPTITPNKNVYCNTEVAEFTVAPFNSPPFTYEWLSTVLNNGMPFTWLYNPLRVDFTGASPGPFNLHVREVSFGCYGSYTAPTTIFITTLPDVSITGEQLICTDAEYTYTTTFLPQTFYDWSVTGADMIDTANNEITINALNADTVQLALYTVNLCGVRDTTFTIIAKAGLPAQFTGLPTELCTYENPFTLHAVPPGGTFAGSGVSDDSFIPSMADTGMQLLTYIYLDSAGCPHTDSATIYIDACTGISNATNIISNIYPNPATTTLHITIATTTAPTITLQLLTTTGKAVLSKVVAVKNNSAITLDITDVANGVYILKAVAEKEFIGKVVVMK